MVRSLSQWTKTLSFPARISPNRNSKECNVNVHPITPPPALPRKNQQSPSPTPNVPITEISQIVSVNNFYFHTYSIELNAVLSIFFFATQETTGSLRKYI